MEKGRNRAPDHIKQLKKIAYKAISYAQEESVKKGLLDEKQSLPLLIQPKLQNLDFADWIKGNHEYVEKELLYTGAILFRNTNIVSPQAFERLARAFTDDHFHENGEHPRASVNGNIYTPVFFPPEKPLLWHNENSFNCHGPVKIWFCCVIPAQSGGETPIVDSRAVFKRLDSGIRNRFMQKDVMYIRNYNSRLGLSWEEVFRTTDKKEVEARCKAEQMEFEWKSEKHLKTWCVRPAVVQHPKTGEKSWFNQALHWHPSCLDTQTYDALLSLFKEADFPRSCCYGDGSPIENSLLAAICDVYRELEVCFPWQRGDVLLLDNILTAHARNPYQGERMQLVAMGDMIDYLALGVHEEHSSASSMPSDM